MKDSKLQIRLSSDDKQKLIDLANDNNMSLTDFIVMKCTDKEKNCHDNDIEVKCTDKENECHDSYLSKYYDIMSKYNYLESQLLRRISIFDDNYSCDQLGSFLWDVEFIEKFRQAYEKEWKNNKAFQDLFEQLKKVYHAAFNSEQEIELKIDGRVSTAKEMYRAISV